MILAKPLKVELEVYKVDRDGIAHLIGGNTQLDARNIPAFPALIIGEHVLIGADILMDAWRIIRGKVGKTQ